MCNDLKANKDNSVAFYKMAYLGEPEQAISLYMGQDYIQHNPAVEDGKQGFIRYFTEMSRDYPNKKIKFLRVIAEGELVALHTHQTWPDDDEYVTMDFFRFDQQGKIIEHWDAIQGVPKQAANPNTMF